MYAKNTEVQQHWPILDCAQITIKQHAINECAIWNFLFNSFFCCSSNLLYFLLLCFGTTTFYTSIDFFLFNELSPITLFVQISFFLLLVLPFHNSIKCKHHSHSTKLIGMHQVLITSTAELKRNVLFFRHTNLLYFLTFSVCRYARRIFYQNSNQIKIPLNVKKKHI